MSDYSPGQNVKNENGDTYLLIDRAAPSGWWVVPAGGGKPMRLLTPTRDRGWRLPRDEGAAR